MDYEFLKRLYRACAPDIAVDPRGLGGLFNPLDATQTAHKRFAERLAQANLPSGELGGPEYLAAEECLTYEEKGFINSFQLGFMLARELADGGDGL